METTLTLSERIGQIRKKEITGLKKAPNAWGAEQNDPPKHETYSRRIENDFTPLLSVYCADGREWAEQNGTSNQIYRSRPYKGVYHKHDYIEILYVAEGSFDQILLGERRHFEKGEIVITDTNCEHADFIDSIDSAILFLGISSDYMDRLLKNYNEKDELQRFLFHSLSSQKREQGFLEFLYNNSGEDNEMDVLMNRIFDESENKRPGYAFVLDGLLIRLFYKLCRDYSPSLHYSEREGKEKVMLYEVERYVRMHYAEVTISDLENCFHYHRNYYNLLLKKYRNMTFKEYVQYVRLGNARQLLENTDQPVHKISQACGYDNTSFFYRIFEERYGIKPLDARKQKG